MFVRFFVEYKQRFVIIDTILSHQIDNSFLRRVRFFNNEKYVQLSSLRLLVATAILFACLLEIPALSVPIQKGFHQKMSRFISIAKTVCKQQTRFALNSSVRRFPVQFQAYSTSIPAFGGAAKDEVNFLSLWQS